MITSAACHRSPLSQAFHQFHHLTRVTGVEFTEGRARHAFAAVRKLSQMPGFKGVYELTEGTANSESGSEDNKTAWMRLALPRPTTALCFRCLRQHDLAAR